MVWPSDANVAVAQDTVSASKDAVINGADAPTSAAPASDPGPEESGHRGEQRVRRGRLVGPERVGVVVPAVAVVHGVCSWVGACAVRQLRTCPG